MAACIRYQGIKESEKQKRGNSSSYYFPHSLPLPLLLYLFPEFDKCYTEESFIAPSNYISLWLQPRNPQSPGGKPRPGSRERQALWTTGWGYFVSDWKSCFGIPKAHDFISQACLLNTVSKKSFVYLRTLFIIRKMCKVPFIGSLLTVSIIYLSIAFSIELFYFIKIPSL